MNGDEVIASVVIPARNASRTIAEQLRGLVNQDFTGTWEIVVVDNGSHDDTATVVNAWARQLPACRVIQEERAGVNIARNAGVRAARGEFVLICDADDVASPGWISGLLLVLRDFDLAGGALDTTRLNEHAATNFERNVDDDSFSCPMGFLPYPPGGNCGFRRVVWQELGGFDESYSGGGDEVEFFWRAQLAGYRLGRADDAVMYVRDPSTRADAFRRSVKRWEARAHLYRDFRDRGLEVDHNLRGAVKRWAWLLLHLPDVLRPNARERWLSALARSWGLLRGSLRFRVLLP